MKFAITYLGICLRIWNKLLTRCIKKNFGQKQKSILRWYINFNLNLYIKFISQNNKVIFSVSSLLFLIFLNSSGNTEARPTDVLQPYNSEDNHTFFWLCELEKPNPNRRGSGLGDEKFLNLQIYITNDNTIIEEMKQLENSSKPDLRETAIQDEASAVGEADAKLFQVSRTARNAVNACIKRFVYRIIYNLVFKIPVCKQSCKTKFRTVNFSNGKNLAIAYDCYNWSIAQFISYLFISVKWTRIGM